VDWGGGFVGFTLDLVFKMAFLIAGGGRVFFTAWRRGDVEKNWERWKLLEGKKRWIVRGVKALWCRKKHPLEKADICDTAILATSPIDIPKRPQNSP
jgi:hypothetical protein